ncbi:Urease, partial [Vibrio xuii]
MSEEYDQGEEIEIEAIGIEVSSQPIELYKVFKIANLVGGGGEAKHIISEGYVAVNGELETRKRRKMYDGDFFEFNQEYYVVVCDAPVTEPEPKPKQPVSQPQ